MRAYRTKGTTGSLVLATLRLIHADPWASAEALAGQLGVSRATLRRTFNAMHDDYWVRIEWSRESSSPTAGRYQIRDWGVFSRRRVLG
ncbi:helix-turn-helix domain-containing protein [Thioalkalivibrio thiocyanodenitrificans]|uniref:helix-turn-helix domain-containing protein n=1 Tax=Thioalkalivibrio thiocyanodenitrificans TaxID=243063 RepID=UPI0018DB73C2|nr:helix-turn-helix domain-containing protein [Thioalkalivibrio thiocyanodenitrificans]